MRTFLGTFVTPAGTRKFTRLVDGGATLLEFPPSKVHWVQPPVGRLPNAATADRNTLLTGGTNNFDLTLFKSFPIREGKRLGTALGGSQCLESSAVCASPRAQCQRAWPGGWTSIALFEPRFHRHPQHVGAGEGDFLRCRASPLDPTIVADSETQEIAEAT